MDAVLSGVSETAFCREGDRWFSVHLEQPDVQVVRSPQEQAHFLRGDGRLVFLKDVNLPAALERLRQLSDEEDMLDLALMVMDSNVSPGLRHEAAEVLEEMLASEHLQLFLENLLFSRPLPEETREEKRWEASAGVSLPRVEQLLHRLWDSQTEIDRVFSRWEALSEDLFEARGGKLAAGFMLMEQGWFRKLAMALREDQVAAVTFEALTSLSRFPNGRDIVMQWVHDFKKKTSLPFPKIMPEETQQDNFRERPVVYEGDILENITRQKEAFIQALRDKKEANARQFLEDLLAFQAKHGEPVFAAKTLCDLAIKTREMGLPDWELALTLRAVQTNPEDARAWGQRGDTLARSSLWVETVEAFEQAIQWDPSNVWAKNYRAQALKTLTRLEEALEAYEKIIKEHPENVVARTGRAEVLKTLNRLEEALAAYDETIAAHPENVVARNGRAEVLKTLNRLEEALIAYDETIKEHPENVVVRTGRAEVLKALNRLEEALIAYEETIDAHPENVAARNGRAEVLKALNRLEEALAAYEETIAAHPEDVVARNGRAGVLKTMHRLEEALEAYEEGLARDTEDTYAKNGRGGVLLMMGKLDEAQAQLSLSHAPRTQGDWAAQYLCGVIHLKKGEIDAASRLFSEGMAHAWPIHQDYFRSGLAVARLQQNRLEDAEVALSQVTTPEMTVTSSLLRIHLFSLRDQADRAKAAFQSLKERVTQGLPGMCGVLLDEMDRRLFQKRPGREDHAFLFQQETLCLAMV